MLSSRFMELTLLYPQKGWQCKGSESGTPFLDLDLDEEWCDYDEDGNCPVGISELEYKIV